MLGQGVGPVFGGILSEYLGFRSIFWFLAILSTVSLLTILFFLPETLRSIAGNGTVPLHGIHKPWIYFITGQRLGKEGATAIPDGPRKKITMKTVVAPLGFLSEKDVFVTLFYGAIVYSVWSMVTSSTSDLFESTYGLNTLQVGLTFLGNGLLYPLLLCFFLFSLRDVPFEIILTRPSRLWLHVRIVHDRVFDGFQPQKNRTRVLHPKQPAARDSYHHQDASRFSDRIRPHAQHLVDHCTLHHLHLRVRILIAHTCCSPRHPSISHRLLCHRHLHHQQCAHH